MSSVVISGDTSGAITLQAPAVSGNTTLNLPASSGTVLTQNSSAPANSFVVDASGNVGIGTGSPSFPLDVNKAGGGAIRGGHGFNWYNSDNTNNYYIYNAGATGSSNANLLFVQGGVAERMRIDGSGNVLIGTTSTTPRDFTSGTGCKIPQSGGPFEFATSDSNVSFINYTATASGAGTFIVFRQQGATRGTISTNGSTTAYNTSSDYRLKENVTPMIGALNVIAQLNPVTYIWKNTGKDGQGFIAHELQSVVPDAVTGEKDAVDDEGNPVYQGVDTSFLVATLTKAIQELKAIVDEQAEKIKALEAK